MTPPGRGSRPSSAKRGAEPRRHDGAAGDISVTVQPRFHLRRCQRADRLSRRSRHQPSLCLALPRCAPGLDPWLRHHRPQPHQSRDRRDGGSRRSHRPAQAPRHGARARFRAEPYGRRRQGQCLVARRARMGPRLALCRVLRHQLAGRAPRSHRQDTASGARRPIWRDPREGRDRAALRSRRRQLQRVVLGPSLSDLAAALCGDPAARRSAGGGGGGAAAACGCLRQAEGSARAARAVQAPCRGHAAQGTLGRSRPTQAAGERGLAARRRALHALLEAQAYRIAYWRVAADEINYRRFFNINDLAGIRIELPELFERAHRLVLTLVAEGRLQGLRIDHIDGLFDPAGYCERLQREAAAAAQVPAGTFYITVEKILAPYETLRDWPIAGTTGYDFIREVGGLFIDPAGEKPLLRIWRRFTGRTGGYDAALYAGK